MTPPIGGCKHLCPLAHLIQMSVATLTRSQASAIDQADEGIFEWDLITVGQSKGKGSPIYYENLGNGDKKPWLSPDKTPKLHLHHWVLLDIQIKYDCGDSEQIKVQVFMQSPDGVKKCFGGGYYTYWSINLLAGLAALTPQELTGPDLHFSSWRGTAQNQPAFICVKIQKETKKDRLLYAELKELKQIYDKNKQDGQLLARVEQVVESLQSVLKGNTYYADAEVVHEIPGPNDGLTIID